MVQPSTSMAPRPCSVLLHQGACGLLRPSLLLESDPLRRMLRLAASRYSRCSVHELSTNAKEVY